MTAGAAERHKHSPELESLDLESNVDVIIQYKQAPVERHHSKVTARGGMLRTHLSLVNGAHYTIPATSLEALAADPEVLYISPNNAVWGALDLSAAAVNADQVRDQYNLDGSGIAVAVIDSGFSAHPDVHGSTVVYQQNFTSEKDSHDNFGHGTHVIGIIAGNAHSSS